MKIPLSAEHAYVINCSPTQITAADRNISVECNQSHNDDGCQTNGEDDDLLRLTVRIEMEPFTFRTIVSLLHTLVPFLVSCDPPVLKNGDTLKLRFSGDGRQVGRSQSHVLMTMCVLNEGEAVLTPNKQYT